MRRRCFALPLVSAALLLLAAGTPVHAQSADSSEASSPTATPSSTSYIFAEVPWGTTAAGVKARFAEQDLTYMKIDKEGDLWFSGRLLGYDAQIIAGMAKGRLVKVIVNIMTPDDDAIATFLQMERTLVAKYGDPTQKDRDFTDPYYLGDGYETQAIRLGKATIRDLWSQGSEDAGTLRGVGLRIADNLTVHVFYESPAWFVEAKRRERVEGKIF